MWRFAGLLLGWALISCGGLADDPRGATTDGVTPERTSDERPTAPDRCEGVEDASIGGQPSDSEPSEDEPAAGGTGNADEPSSAAAGVAGEPGAGSEPKDACSDVCSTLAECAGEQLAQCSSRCEESAWVETHDIRCLALRIYWIDEEGCAVMLDTYEQFEPDDDCSD